MSSRISRDEAWSLLCEWVESEPLRRHCQAVEASMRAYARRNGADEELWGVVGLLHDMDYERYPGPRDRPSADGDRGARARAAIDPVIIRAIASHADFMDVSRDSDMEKTLLRRRRAVGLRPGLRLRAARRASTA